MPAVAHWFNFTGGDFVRDCDASYARDGGGLNCHDHDGNSTIDAGVYSSKIHDARNVLMARGEMKVLGSRPLVPISAAILALSTLVVGATVARGGGTVVDDPDAQRAAIVAKAPTLPDLIPAFARDQVEADRIPGSPLEDLNATGTLKAGEDPRLSRRLDLGSDAEIAYAWPADERVCYAFASAGGCTPMRRLADEGVVLLSTFQSSDPTVRMFGLVATGVRDVEVTLSDGTTIPPPIAENGFSLTLTSDPVSVTWVKPDGSRGMQKQTIPRGS